MRNVDIYTLESIYSKKSKLPYLSTNYLSIAKVSEYEMIQGNDKDTDEQSTPQSQ